MWGRPEAQTSSCRDPLTVEIYASASWEFNGRWSAGMVAGVALSSSVRR